MVKSVEGIYRNGQVQFLEPVPEVQEARVIVTFLEVEPGEDLPGRGIDDTQAADLRWRFQAFAPDWDRPEMDVYNDL